MVALCGAHVHFKSVRAAAARTLELPCTVHFGYTPSPMHGIFFSDKKLLHKHPRPVLLKVFDGRYIHTYMHVTPVAMRLNKLMPTIH
jgi:hypothetical protein